MFYRQRDLLASEDRR